MIDIKIALTHDITKQISDRVRRNAGAVVGKTAAQILADSKDSMTGAKHGRVYRMGNVTHQASAPGEAPAIDTGNLSGSGYVKRLDTLNREVGFSAEYAPVLEGAASQFESGGLLDMAEALGMWMAPNADEMLPRPFLRPAVEANRASFEAAMRKVAG